MLRRMLIIVLVLRELTWDSLAEVGLHGQTCNPAKDQKQGDHVSCGVLRHLHCNDAGSPPRCECQKGMEWDPQATRDEDAKPTIGRSVLQVKRINKADDKDVLGSCKLKFGSMCTKAEECFSGLVCTGEEGRVKKCTKDSKTTTP
ncbi:unnamed protein product [Allacma fusca]|uniref:Uncharacterized protein n=1 Tax=Allacma fusca TaxID=39272 RepID=A0A8J2MAK6_9HEXA|nr:unnamed protein product [Allacma fusca]